MKTNYFAYGSNMDVERLRKRNVSFSKRASGHLQGYRLEFNKIAQDNPLMGYVNIVPDANSLVEGALYEIDAPSLQNLDNFEGGYSKITVKIKVFPEEQETSAVTYIANPKKIKDGLKPSKEYLGHLLAGKDILSKDYFEKLTKIETID